MYFQTPKDQEFDWDSYLSETSSEAAPASNFKQSLIPPENEFIIGEKLETIDPRNKDSWCIGTVINKDGPRLRIRLDGTDDRNDFWQLVDSANIRSYGTTAKLGGQIVPPLGFPQNASRWPKYFEKNIKNGPFANESCFKPQPLKPEKNLFKKGQKLEAIDPKHPQLICPATVTNITPGDHRIIISLDGWSSSNTFKIDYSSRDIFPVGWCKSAGIRIAKVGENRISSNKTLPIIPNKQNENLRNKKTVISSGSNHLPKTKSIKKENDIPLKEHPIVTVYWNYVDDNGGILLNPQKFHSSMPLMFGPNECNLVLKNIFDSCIQCSFQPTSFINRILDLFTSSKDKKKKSSTQIKLENGMLINLPFIENEDQFWDIIRIFQNGILAGNDLFISTPHSNNDSSINHNIKRKSIEYNSGKYFLTNGKALRSTSNEKSPYDTKSSLNVISHRSERFTPSDVAKFVREIDPSFDSLASRFLQEEIDGKALLLLTTDTLMRHMGLKLGPSLKIIHYIEKLKENESF